MAEPVAENISESVQNVTTKIPATPEGMAVAYSSLVIMALVPIFLGSYRSVCFHKELKKLGEKTESMTAKDAAMFPLFASCALFGLYLVFKIFSKEYLNLLVAIYCFGLGLLTLSYILSPFVNKLIPRGFPNENYHLKLTREKNEEKEDVVDYKFDRVDLVTLAFAFGVGVWYLVTKHWIANNMFGLAFALNGVEFIPLNKVTTGCILLSGLFVYDIFWVFMTEVMVTVAKSFDAPIKLVFPQDLLENGLAAKNFAMLGLGDIVVPGIFIAMMLRYDMSVNQKQRTYFIATFLAYFLGLLLTIFVMHVFKHAQPALLYLVPLCLGAPMLVAVVKGDLKNLLSYEDNPEPEETDKSTEKKDK